MNTASFTSFFENWLIQQQNLLDELFSYLNSPPKNCIVKDLTGRVIFHYSQFYEEKSRAANRSPFPFFSPPWLTSFEKSLLWVTGFKPSIIFRLVAASVGHELTEGQQQQVEREKSNTRRREREVTEKMARVQESVAAPPIHALMREDRRLIDGEVDELCEAMEALMVAMRRVMEDADSLRGSTVKSVLDILNPLQKIKFLAAAGQYLLQVRRWGLLRDSPTSV